MHPSDRGLGRPGQSSASPGLQPTQCTGESIPRLHQDSPFDNGCKYYKVSIKYNFPLSKDISETDLIPNLLSHERHLGRPWWRLQG